MYRCELSRRFRRCRRRFGCRCRCSVQLRQARRLRYGRLFCRERRKNSSPQNSQKTHFIDPLCLCAESFSDKFYGAVDRGATAINNWTGKYIADPVYEWGTSVNDWLDDRSTAEKIGIAFSPIAGGVLLTEGPAGAFVRGVVAGTVPSPPSSGGSVSEAAGIVTGWFISSE